MLFTKSKFDIVVKKGKGRVLGPAWKGLINYLIVIPEKWPISYDFKVLDSDGDAILHVKQLHGRLDYNEGVVVGKSIPEELVFVVENSWRSMKYTIILLMKER